MTRNLHCHATQTNSDEPCSCSRRGHHHTAWLRASEEEFELLAVAIHHQPEGVNDFS